MNRMWGDLASTCFLCSRASRPPNRTRSVTPMAVSTVYLSVVSLQVAISGDTGNPYKTLDTDMLIFGFAGQIDVVNAH